ncbi:MAG: CRISPR-associated helicase Cas3' [Thermovirgaceae bacterium]
MTKSFIAHVKQNDKGEWITQDLSDHLEGTAIRAAKFADDFGNSDWGYFIGLLHDLGKFHPNWQRYIRVKSGYDPEAHIESAPGKINHSTAGAVHVFDILSKAHPIARIFGYPIAGHHAGLTDWYPDDAGGDLQNRIYDSLNGTLRTDELGEIKKNPETLKFLSASFPKSTPVFKKKCEGNKKDENQHIWVRMLFSCLVDADYLDTEEFMDPAKSEERQGYPTLSELKARFDSFMDMKVSQSNKSPINLKREEVLDLCREKSSLPPGFFSLTVPTGGGKTLSSMAFALEHALSQGKKRVIMAIPFTSIIEQTAKVLKYGTDMDESILSMRKDEHLFGEGAVIEHHSNLDPENETAKNRLASENWDAPIIVTTNVQLFESLFASQPSSCRKLHNLVNSVVILDEAQMLPPEYLKPILSVLKVLVEDYGVTVLFCTATQPAFSGTVGSSQTKFEGIPECIEIIDDPESLYKDLKRVEIKLPEPDMVSTWKEISEELNSYEQVLCIVNTRRDCRDLHKLMPEGTVHLSALMCGEERSEVISDIKKKLSDSVPIKVISTQLVEAGVDIDFPVVYRAMSGMDSIAQAAGRCNREGKLCYKGEMGQVVVFSPSKPAPPGLLRKGEDAARTLIRNKSVNELSPELFRDYFRNYFASINDLDKPDFERRLKKEADEFKFQFRTFSRDFNLIDNTKQKPVIIWYKGRTRDSREIIEELKKFGPNKSRLRKLQRFTVNIPYPLWQKLIGLGYIEEVHGFSIQAGDGLYKPGLGLIWEEGEWMKDVHVC